VVKSASEYVSAALSISMNPALRMKYTEEILLRLHKVFDNETQEEEAVLDWRR
jgi:hypothetical protein